MEQNVTGLQHIGIPTDDVEKMIAFYERLGFSLAHRTINQNNGQPVAFLEMNGLIIETWQGGTPGRTGSIAHFTLNVLDVDAQFAMMKEAGFDICEEEVQFLAFWENGVRFFNITGPNGEVIEYCQKL